MTGEIPGSSGSKPHVKKILIIVSVGGLLLGMIAVSFLWGAETVGKGFFP